MTRKIDHKQLKSRAANTGDILRVTGADDLSFIDPNTMVVAALAGGQNIVIESNGLIVGATQDFSGNTDIVPEGVANLYFTNDRVLTAIETAPTILAGNIIPLQNSFYNLGNATHRWGIIYVSAGTISLGNLYLKEGTDGKLVITTNPANTESDAGLIDLTTDDILEGSNLYFTNTRAVGSLTGGFGVVVNANGLIVSTGEASVFSGTTDGVNEGTGNLYFTNARAIAAVEDNINTSNVIEGSNLYFTDARAIAAVRDNIDTSNVAEGANLYFTNTRAIGSLTAGNGITIEANGLIVSTGEASVFTGDTDGVAEGVNNLYFTDNRALAAVIDSITTDNVIEGINLYFTNTRAIGALTGGDNITIEANGLIVGQPGYTDEDSFANVQLLIDTLTTDDIQEGSNLYFTNARAVAAVQDNITTSNVAEGANLYFTNARAIGSLTAGDGIAIQANGLVVATTDATPTFDSVNVGDLTVSGNLTVTGNLTTINAQTLEIVDPLIKLAANNETSDAVDFGFVGHYSPDAGTTSQHAGMFRDSTDGHFYVFSEYVDEELDSGNLVSNIDRSNNTFKLATVHANVFVGNVTGTVSTLSNHDTTDLAEGSNLYFTNTRAIGALTAGNGITIEANGLVVSSGEASTFTGNTDGVAEGTSNLYFTNARSIAALTGGDNITIESNGLIVGQPGYSDEDAYANIVGTWWTSVDTDDIPEGTANLYFTNTRAIGSFTSGAGIEISANGLLTANLSGLNVEASNIFTDSILVQGNVEANGLIINGFEVLSSTSAGDINANTLTANVVISRVWSGLYTDNVIEGANLYFTNTRAIGAFVPGSSIVIEANGYINTANVSAYLSYASSQTFTGNGVQQVFTLSSSIDDPDTLIVSINGLVKVPETDYTVSGNQLTFISAPAGSAAIEVRYLNITTSTALEYYTRTYSGDGSSNTFALSYGLAPNAVVVFENGLAQVPYADYTVVGSNIIFTNPPGAATTIQIRELPLQGREFTEIIGNTSNIIEGANLYFTNTRAVGAFTAGDNIVIESNGVISANVVGALSAGENIVLESNGMIISSGGGGGGGDASPLSVSRRSILTAMIFG
jgi:hypothetical protein